MKKQKRFSHLFMALFLGFFSLMISSCDEQGSNISSNGTSNSIEHVHEWNEGEVFLEATCQKEGLIIYTCLTCEEENYVKTDPLGHNIVVDEAKEATCTTTGLTEGKHCDRCGEVLVCQQQIGTVAHKETIIPAVEATCSSTGLTEGKKCSECDMILVYQQVVPVLEHKIVVDEAKEATCESSGLTVGSHCSECNKVIIEQIEIPALSHDYGSLIAKVDATCENEGTIAHYKCENCNSYFNENKEAIDNIVIPATGHKFDKSNWISDETGHWYECTNCGKKDSFSSHKPNIDSATEYDDKVCTICEYIIEEALGHTHTMSYTKAKKETCESNGNIAYYYCTGCKKYYSDKDGTNVISSSSIVKKATGHNYKAEEVKPTCEEQGYTIHTCSYCYDYYIDSYVEPTGHNYNTVVTEPTCTSQGYTTHTCEDCGDSYINNYEDALGHSEVIDKAVESTCTETGLTEGSHCDRCNEIFVSQEEVAMKEHNYVDYVCSECGDDNYYTKGLAFQLETNGEYTVFYFNGTDTDIIIPKKYKGLPVTKIGVYLFDGWGTITSVSIPDSIKYIERSAFKGCNSLTSIIIPESVTSIGYGAFSGCSSLTSITIPESVTSIDYNAFYECSSLTSITIPDGVTSIGSWTFSGCSSLTSVTIGNGVTRIGNEAFSGCSSLTSITIPESVTSIGYGVFSGCSSLTSMTIPESVTSIGSCAFSGCSSLESIAIPESVTSIGNYAFEKCVSLTSITIPESVTSIGDDAFLECSSLTKVYYNGTIEDWCDITFGYFYSNPLSNDAWLYINNEKVTEIIISNEITSIGNYAFHNCISLTSVTISDGVTNIGDSAFRNCSSLTSITIPESVTIIGDSAFRNCSSLTNITIPDSVISIGPWAFSECSSLTKVYYNGTIEDWCDITFDNIFSNPLCNGADLYIDNQKVTDIEIPNGVTSIGNYAFYNYDSLTSVTIGNGVTSIGEDAFRSCGSLTSVTIGNGVTRIGKDAFKSCWKLSIVYYNGAEEQWNEIFIASGNNYLLNAEIIFNNEN